MKMCLIQGKMIKTLYPDLADKHTVHEKRIWNFKMTKIKKTECVLEGNLQIYLLYLWHFATLKPNIK